MAIILRRKPTVQLFSQSFKLVNAPSGGESANKSNPLETEKQVTWNYPLEQIREFHKNDFEYEEENNNEPFKNNNELIEYWHVFQGDKTPCLICDFDDVDHHSHMITKEKNQEVQRILKQRAKNGDTGMYCYKCQKIDHRRQDCPLRLCTRCHKWVNHGNHNCPSNNYINISQLFDKPKTPTYVMNVVYNDAGIFLSKRIDKSKEMYNFWQVPGGKVEENEYSIEAVIRETEEETGLIIKKNIPKLIFNDPKFNCDVYVTKVDMNTVLRNTEPNKQSSWILNTFKQYEEKCKRNEITPTHVRYMKKILENLKISKTIAQAQWEERKPQDAYFAEAEVFGRKINVMIDTGAVGCIITKSFLDSVHKEIEASTNVQIVSVTGAKTASLGKMFKVGVKIGKFEIKEDMIVTEASGYNILLGNDWITNQAKAIINTGKQNMTIKQNNEIDIVPITCFIKINPEIFTLIDFFEEKYNELELEETEGEPQHYLNVSLEENIAIINHQRYPTEFLEFSDLEFQRTDKYWKGPGRCLCKPLQNNEKCSFCRKLYKDLEYYRVAKAQIKKDDELIEITTEKDTPIESLTNMQKMQL
jgi:ADP-ribose pyrophosphatase YjhB (NUDIX family)